MEPVNSVPYTQYSVAILTNQVPAPLVHLKKSIRVRKRYWSSMFVNQIYWNSVKCELLKSQIVVNRLRLRIKIFIIHCANIGGLTHRAIKINALSNDHNEVL